MKFCANTKGTSNFRNSKDKKTDRQIFWQSNFSPSVDFCCSSKRFQYNKTEILGIENI